ncbi:MAG TPA: GatB/YqeY domain-containing protein [Promineifilum sp.]|nr:GatB/YqeY domain-containing protein [Promineifilum sp.]HRO24104.1 GatB/YqeY domain-containing protein [Promineifilum sp.]HRO90164.1 GatB/YqeY domain-containing protein [Promineifilum sp.]HRQ12073.1 GatB/YqeY domain-containing protein [Promineifilum sp.]
MDLKEKLRADLATAMREGDSQRRDVLRMVLAAVKQVEIDDRKTLDDDGVQEVLRKQVKLRQESIVDFEKAGRPSEVERERAEIVIIEGYLPQMMSREEIEQIARGIIDELGVTNAKAMGQVMSRLMPYVKGKADGRVVNEVVRSLLQ